MNKIMATLVALSMVIVTVPATADSAETTSSLEDRLAMAADDLEPLEEVTLGEFLASTDLTVTLDSALGNDAGCNAAAADSTEWAAAGTPDAPCAFEMHSYGITHTSVSCGEDACVVDALDWATFGFVIVSCDADSSALVDWTEGTIATLTGSCEAGVAGDPASFASWDSLGNGDWTHADNPGDALYHLLL